MQIPDQRPAQREDYKLMFYPSRAIPLVQVVFGIFAASVCVLMYPAVSHAQDKDVAQPKPLRALLVIGGCFHDYAVQKDILKAGLEERINITVDIAYTDDKSLKPKLPNLGNPKYADGYDLVIHDECAPSINDPEIVEAVLAPHRAGLPGVNLHCAMHCFRTAADVTKPVQPGTSDSLWFDYLGIQSSGHGAQKPISIDYTNATHPIAIGLPNWTTINEELYNNIAVSEGAHPIARGIQEPNTQPKITESIVVWTHEFGDHKARVFSTTLGHNNDTVADARYLDLVARGVLWACGKLQDSGLPADGYGR